MIAPHSFFPGSSCLRLLLEKNLHVFDAIECSGFLIRGIDFNRKSIAIAEKSGKPLVACGDVHYLWQLNRTVTWIYAEPNVQSILHAVKQGFVRVQVLPISWFKAFEWWTTTRWRYIFPVNPAPPKHAWNSYSLRVDSTPSQETLREMRVNPDRRRLNKSAGQIKSRYMEWMELFLI